MFVGFATSDITPPRGIYLSGYGHPWRRNKGVHCELKASACAVRQSREDAPVVVVSVDTLALHEHSVERIRAAVSDVVPPSNVHLCATHSHASPVVSVGARPDSPEGHWVNTIESRVAAVIRQACSQFSPATARIGSAPCAISVNRRLSKGKKVVMGWNEDGPLDPNVRVIRFLRAESEGASSTRGEVLAQWVLFACHPTVLPPGNKLASAEWPGRVRERFEEDGIPTLVLQGACGDIAARADWSDGHHMRSLERVAGAIYDSAVVAAAESTDLAPGVICARSATVSAPISQPTEGPEGYLRLQRKYTHLPRWAARPLLERLYPWWPMIEFSRTEAGEARATVDMALSVLRIGPLRLVLHAAESFCATGLRIQAEGSDDAPVWFVGYANGMVGYLPPREELDRGGYETDLAAAFYRYPGRFADDAEERAVAATLQLLRGD